MRSNILDILSNLSPATYNAVLFGIALLSGIIIKIITSFGIRHYRNSQRFSFLRSMVLRLSIPVAIMLPVLVFNFLLPLMKLDESTVYAMGKAIEVLLIVCFAWLLIALLKVSEDYVYHSMDLTKHNNLRQRKIRTQLRFLRQVGILLIVMLGIGAILLSFSSLRRLGAGLLTGVGIGGIIVGLAAQRSISNLLAGFQIAFTQPIRLDDVLVVEGEWGKVEEINLTYVVLNIWDQRRLILPINYFLEKPFQNWTRNTAEILGTVFIYLDYSAPIDSLREEFERLLQSSPLWDKRVGVVQVTNTTEHTMEVRALMSAADSGKAFDLRCMVREKLVSFISTHYPESLPRTRAVINRENEFLSVGQRFQEHEGQLA